MGPHGTVRWLLAGYMALLMPLCCCYASAATADAGVIVLTGTGRAFCAGGYLANLSDPDPEALRSMFYGSLKVYEAIRTSPRPVIAAVNGAAAGGGNELVIACDLAIAADTATFGQTGVKIGSAPVLGGTNFLAMVVGEKRAKEIAFMCRRYPAEKALEIGLINPRRSRHRHGISRDPKNS